MSGHVVHKKLYILVFAALIALTALTTGVAQRCRSLACLHPFREGAYIPAENGGTYAPPWFFDPAALANAAQRKAADLKGRSALPRSTSVTPANQIQQREEKNPNNIHEVPVEARHLYGAVALG